MCDMCGRHHKHLCVQNYSLFILLCRLTLRQDSTVVPSIHVECGQDIASPRKQERPELSQKERRRVLRDAQKEP